MGQGELGIDYIPNMLYDILKINQSNKTEKKEVEFFNTVLWCVILPFINVNASEKALFICFFIKY